jgi:mycothiol synthase
MASTNTREIWLMRTELTKPFTETVPANFSWHSFEVGKDETAFLAANADSFANHPEQGFWTMADLVERFAEPWFIPADFFLLRDEAGEIAGFVWIKIHIERLVPDAEIYLIGLTQKYQLKGMGKALLAHGLNQIYSKGFNEAIIYVDAPNTAALSLYKKHGFKHISTQIVEIKRRELN